MSKIQKDANVGSPVTKRKFDGEDGGRGTSIKKHKKSKSKSSEQPKHKSRGPAQSRSIDHDESVALKDPALLVDFFAQKLAKHDTDSTSIERQDISIQKSWLQDTTEFDQAHVASHLAAFLEKFVKGGKDALSSCSTKATPHTLILASSGIRVADLVRELRIYHNENSKVAKLIAKHMKLKDNVAYLAQTKVGIAVGTPVRLKDLVEQQAIKTDGLSYILIDVSYLDEKKRGLADMAEVFEPLLHLLHHEHIRTRLEADDGAKILVF